MSPPLNSKSCDLLIVWKSGNFENIDLMKLNLKVEVVSVTKCAYLISLLPLIRETIQYNFFVVPNNIHAFRLTLYLGANLRDTFETNLIRKYVCKQSVMPCAYK